MSNHYDEDRDAFKLDKAGGYYTRHVVAMTKEGLHSKSDIAAELAHRDYEIDKLKAQVEQLSILCLAYEDKIPFPVMTKELFEPIFKARNLLAEIKAQAIEDFIVALCRSGVPVVSNAVMDFSEEYANQLRQQVKENKVCYGEETY